MRVLVTGAAGFIGFHLCKRLLERGDEVVGVDNMNDYYDVSLKQARLAELDTYRVPSSESRVPNSGCFNFYKIDISDRAAMEQLFAEHAFDRVINLAAQAGVRYSLENPYAYIQANIVGFMNVLECCRHQWTGIGNRDSELANPSMTSESRVPSSGSRHLVFASSSSVYGINTKLPFSTGDNVDHPISLYAATKKANELMAHTYSHLYGIPCTGLRFFTVYGPWGRPDMALFKFTKAIRDGETIDVYNEGNMRRDFTYIDDIVEGIVRVSDRIPRPRDNGTTGQREEIASSRGPVVPSSRVLDPGSSPTAPYKIYNIGNHSPVNLMDFIGAIERALGKEAKKRYLPMQLGDVQATYADVDDLMRDVGFAPKTPVADGIGKFVEWYRSYY